ncbi:hypothetical protein CDEST_10926 [Colletotrichum destructivum]|uniref:Uncharacterized protein n=1 Tax=Colletotrichum destructivum TaxID=34406 RepID=A0AAX4IRU9_9PEZI|nr:hypothetical protein CDEST_10926 [Colletotrichum destructivum]
MTNLLNRHLSRHSHLAFWGSRTFLAFGHLHFIILGLDHLHSVVLTLGHPHSITLAFTHLHLIVSCFLGSRIMTYTLQPHLHTTTILAFGHASSSRVSGEADLHFASGAAPSALHHLVFLGQQIHGSTSITLNLDHSLHHHFLDFNILRQQIVWPSAIRTSSSRVSGAADSRFASSLRGTTHTFYSTTIFLRHSGAADCFLLALSHLHNTILALGHPQFILCFWGSRFTLRGIIATSLTHLITIILLTSTFWGNRLFLALDHLFHFTTLTLASLGQQIHAFGTTSPSFSHSNPTTLPPQHSEVAESLWPPATFPLYHP